MPCPCCWGVLGPREGRTLLPCQQHPQNAAWMGSLQRRQERGSLHDSLIKALLEGEEAPSLYWCGPGSQSSPALGCEDPWDRWDPWWLLQGPQISAGQAGIWGCWGWVWKVQDLGSRICTTPPQCRGRNRGTLQPWGCKMPPHPLTEPPPISEPPSPHKGLIWLQD